MSEPNFITIEQKIMLLELAAKTSASQGAAYGTIERTIEDYKKLIKAIQSI